MDRLIGLILITLPIFLIGQNPIKKEGWKLTFNDEFNDKKLDYNKWQDYYYWGGRANPDAVNYYGKDQFQFSDSTLIIVSEKKETEKGYPYTSGMIDCNKSFKQKYGYFEIRSKNPKGTGHWPAFWLVSVEAWPPEIDIYEFYTNNPNVIHTNQHWKKNKEAKKKSQPKTYKMDVDASDDFHTYAIEWTAKKIKWYYDNKKIKTSRRGRKHLKYPMHIIINNEVSDFKKMNLNEAIFPAYFEIDYVRVYKKVEK